MANDVVELRLPLKHEYLPVLRATIGVIAGTITFNYDEIMEIRVAVSEVFNRAMKHTTRRGKGSEENELAVRFVVQPEVIEIQMTGPKNPKGHVNSEEEESTALLKSLMDEVEFGAETSDKTVVRMVRYKPTEES